MAKISTDDLLEAFKEMTLLELSEFVKQFEETFDVKAAAPVAVAAPAAAGAGRQKSAARPGFRATEVAPWPGSRHVPGPEPANLQVRVAPRPGAGQEYCSTPRCCRLHITLHVASVTQTMCPECPV